MRSTVAVLTVLFAAILAPSAFGQVGVSATQSEGIQINGSGLGDRLAVKLQQFTVNGQSTTQVLVVELNSQFVGAGSGCATVTNSSVRCGVPPTRIINAALAAGPDELALDPGVGDCICTGNGGADKLTGGDGQDALSGGSTGGDDVLTGGPGDDLLQGEGDRDTLSGGPGADRYQGGSGDDTLDAGAISDGADVFDGGPGVDTVSYASRRASVAVSIGDGANDGASPFTFEGDDVTGTVETVRGGTAADTLTGNDLPNRLEGGSGNDTLGGGATTNFVVNGLGNLDDVLDGGLGTDRFVGGQGFDQWLARDGLDEQASGAFDCRSNGANTSIVVDLHDDDTRAYPTNCTVFEGAVKEAPNVVIASKVAVRRAGTAKLKLSCPRKTRKGCTGTLAAAPAESSRFGRGARFSLRRGRSATVAVKVPRGGKAARFRTLERGTHGPRTTLQTLRVR